MKLPVLALALAIAASPALAQSARVVDGDTLKVDGVTYRLWGDRRARVGPTVRRWMARRTSSNRTLARTDWRTPRHLRTIAVTGLSEPRDPLLAKCRHVNERPFVFDQSEQWRAERR